MFTVEGNIINIYVYSLEGCATDGVPGGAVGRLPPAHAAEVEVALVVVRRAEVLPLR